MFSNNLEMLMNILSYIDNDTNYIQPDTVCPFSLLYALGLNHDESLFILSELNVNNIIDLKYKRIIYICFPTLFRTL